MEVLVPIQTISEANASDLEHWSKKLKRHKAQKQAVTWALVAKALKIYGHGRVAVPFQFREVNLIVHLQRQSPRLIRDSDNLQSSMKYIRDAVAKWLQRDDDMKSGIEWKYSQIQSKDKGVLIRIEAKE